MMWQVLLALILFAALLGLLILFRRGQVAAWQWFRPAIPFFIVGLLACMVAAGAGYAIGWATS